MSALLLFAALALPGSQQRPSALTPEEQKVVAQITATEMKGNLSFLASDLLEGRGTPSRGLDIAAEFIASRFRAAGLDPAGDDGYFQTAGWPLNSASPTGKVRNVIGVLRGSDPKLKETYVLVTAHYDHLGMKKSGEGDLIYNGADDDGSGTVSVIQLAEALSKAKPKRSIVFVTFFGEELGLKGSGWYGDHPVFPLAKTIADVNLEQVGRTDDTEGPRVDELSMTGYDYDDLGAIFSKAGARAGIKVTKHPRNSDRYFFYSDNAALAGKGVPANTVCTAFQFPDYHQVSDHWDKIDYVNMEHVVKGVAIALLDLSNSEREPRWNPDNPKAARFLDAWKLLRGVPN